MAPLSDIQRGYELLGWGKRPREYVCRASVEHADAAGENAYLMAIVKGSPKVLSDIEEMKRSLECFGVGVRECDAPKELAWLGTKHHPIPEYSRRWFLLDDFDKHVDWLFAAMLYAAFDWRKRAGAKLFGVHLVAQIEGRPNYIDATSKTERGKARGDAAV